MHSWEADRGGQAESGSLPDQTRHRDAWWVRRRSEEKESV